MATGKMSKLLGVGGETCERIDREQGKSRNVKLLINKRYKGTLKWSPEQVHSKIGTVQIKHPVGWGKATKTMRKLTRMVHPGSLIQDEAPQAQGEPSNPGRNQTP
jgi:hypothetical protein